jgi:hypothetical protein
MSTPPVTHERTLPAHREISPKPREHRLRKSGGWADLRAQTVASPIYMLLGLKIVTYSGRSEPRGWMSRAYFMPILHGGYKLACKRGSVRNRWRAGLTLITPGSSTDVSLPVQAQKERETSKHLAIDREGTKSPTLPARHHYALAYIQPLDIHATKFQPLSSHPSDNQMPNPRLSNVTNLPVLKLSLAINPTASA